MKKVLKFIGFVCICALTKGFAILAYLIWKYVGKWNDKHAKDGIQKVQRHNQLKSMCIGICIIGFVVNIIGTPSQPVKQEDKPKAPVIHCNFDGSAYKHEQRSNMLMFGQVGDKYYNIDAFNHTHKSAEGDTVFEQIISWEQNDTVFALYLDGNETNSIVTRDNCGGTYITITSIEHDVVPSTMLMRSGLYSGRDVKMIDVYIAHATIDHIHAEHDEEE